MSKSILIIEDERDLRELLVESLREIGIKETIFESDEPMNGMELFNKHKTHLGLIICDQYMPYANGTEICEIIKSERPDLQILIFTGDKSFHLDKTQNEYINGIFYKPEGLQELCQYIKSHFDIKKSHSLEPVFDLNEVKRKFIILKNRFPGLLIEEFNTDTSSSKELSCVFSKNIECLAGEMITFFDISAPEIHLEGKVEQIQSIDKNIVLLKIIPRD